MNYRSYPAISGTELIYLAECPAKLLHKRNNPTEPTPAMQFGSLVHTLLLEPDQVSNRYAVMPEGMTRRGKEYEALLASSAGKELIKPDDYATARSMIQACKANPLVQNIFAQNRHNEYEVYWEELGVACKGKPDVYLPDINAVVDYKTCADANPKTFGYKVIDRGYLLQLVHYMAGLKQTFGLAEYPSAFIIAQEKEAPYVSTVYELSVSKLSEAMAHRERLLITYKECLETGIWKGYSDTIVSLEIKNGGSNNE